jgi:uncharacterized membrane protein
MMGYGSGGGSMGGIFMIILLVLGVVAVVWVMRARSTACRTTFFGTERSRGKIREGRDSARRIPAKEA